MDTDIIVALVAAVGSIVAASLSALAVVLASQSKAQSRETHLLINSRMTELLELTRSSARAQGVKEGRESRDD